MTLDAKLLPPAQRDQLTAHVLNEVLRCWQRAKRGDSLGFDMELTERATELEQAAKAEGGTFMHRYHYTWCGLDRDHLGDCQSEPNSGRNSPAPSSPVAAQQWCDCDVELLGCAYDADNLDAGVRCCLRKDVIAAPASVPAGVGDGSSTRTTESAQPAGQASLNVSADATSAPSPIALACPASLCAGVSLFEVNS